MLGYAIIDLRGNIHWANSSFYRMFNKKALSKAEKRNMNAFDLFTSDPESKQHLMSSLEAELNRNKSGHLHLQIDRTLLMQPFFRVDLLFLNDFSSAKSGLIYVICTDITAVSRQEKVLRHLVEISNAAVLSQNIKELISFIREQLGKLMDTTNFYIALYHPEDDSFSMPFFSDQKDHFDRVPAGKTLSYYVIKRKKSLLLRDKEFRELVERGEVELIGTDSKVWMGAPLRVNDRIIGMVGLQSYTDANIYSESDKDLLELVSYQIGLAIDRKQKEEELRVEKTYFEQLFRNVPEAIVIQEYPGAITDVNLAFTKLFGFELDEITGKSLNDIIVPDEFMEEAHKITEHIFNGKTIETETVRKKKNGEKIEVSLMVTSFNISKDKTIIYSIYRDISRKKEVERKLVSAKEKAEEADRLKTAFLTNMSHEIRTPMNAIMGFAQLLSSENLSAENKTEYVNIIKNSGDSLLRLIDDILDLAKLESGQVVIREEPVDIDEILKSLYVAFSKMISGRQNEYLTLRYNRERGTLAYKVLTDPVRLRQILNNLLSNAIKFTHSGFVEFGYNIAPSNEIMFFVKDTGIGIPSDKMEIIFKRFLQVDNSKTRLYPGTGLGLAISKRLTELLGGTIWVKSEVGKGSTFYFTIPLKVYQEDTRQSNKTRYTRIRMSLNGKNILVAEDDEFNYVYLREILQQAGVNVFHANTGREVIHFFKNGQKKIDLVLMDIEMPEMNGYDATIYLKEKFPLIPVIAQTAYASMEEKMKCLKVGCDSYLAKPLQSHDLFKEIRKYI